MFSLFLLFICLVGLCYGLMRWGRMPATITPPVLVGLISGLLFLSDYVALLRPTCWLLINLGLIGALVGAKSVWQMRGDWPSFFQGSLLWPIVATLFFALYISNRQQLFHDWDEFSHWGTVIRAVVSANTFHFEPNPLYFQDYPPGTALFAYFVLTILGYSEGGAYFAYALILLAHCIPFFGLASRRGPVVLMASITLSLVLIRFLGHGWSSVLIDHVLSVCFAGLISAYLVIREETGPRWPLALMFITLVLAKHAGTSLALVACVVMVMDSLVISGVALRLSGGGWVGKSLTLFRSTWPWAILPIPAMLLSALWNHYVESDGLARGYGRFGIGELFIRGLNCCSTERERIIVTRYLDHWLGYSEPFSISFSFYKGISGFFSHLVEISGYSPWVLTQGTLLLGLVAVLVATPGTERYRQLMALFVLTISGFLFSLVQLLFYLYAFSEYEALTIASFKRFQNTYYLAWALSALGWATLAWDGRRQLSRTNFHSGWFSAARWGFVFVMILVCAQVLNGASIAPAQRAQRKAIQDWVASLPLPSDGKGSVYIVWQGSNGLEFWETRHEILPRSANRDCYSLGPPHFANDMWSCPVEEAHLREELSGYDYVLVAHGYSDFQHNYPSLVPNLGHATDRALLRIERQEGRLVLHHLT
ncbi:MAG: hypothetical protein EKK46_05325 [Rhodocyclaceae bacterium]|nr:MAG: hypothetical protein EKK46_05325 [Rhodocyclaceae bacterium]